LQEMNKTSATESLSKSLKEVISAVETVTQKIIMKEEKFKNWKAKNIRRKHNYIPFLFNEDACKEATAKTSGRESQTAEVVKP
jgi:ubiquitin carboxyl-terminal hydrolase L5